MENVPEIMSQLLQQSELTSALQATVREAWAVIYAHGGVIAEFASEQEALLEAAQWNGVCLRLVS